MFFSEKNATIIGNPLYKLKIIELKMLRMAANEMVYGEERGNFVTFPNQGIITSLHSDPPDTSVSTVGFQMLATFLGKMGKMSAKMNLRKSMEILENPRKLQKL